MLNEIRFLYVLHIAITMKEAYTQWTTTTQLNTEQSHSQAKQVYDLKKFTLMKLATVYPMVGYAGCPVIVHKSQNLLLSWHKALVTSCKTITRQSAPESKKTFNGVITFKHTLPDIEPR